MIFSYDFSFFLCLRRANGEARRVLRILRDSEVPAAERRPGDADLHHLRRGLGESNRGIRSRFFVEDQSRALAEEIRQNGVAASVGCSERRFLSSFEASADVPGD